VGWKDLNDAGRLLVNMRGFAPGRYRVRIQLTVISLSVGDAGVSYECKSLGSVDAPQALVTRPGQIGAYFGGRQYDKVVTVADAASIPLLLDCRPTLRATGCNSRCGVTFYVSAKVVKKIK
jgi:hypothetical protein